jgi:solute carrier family 66 (lysosomal lysine-arginine transporter), member 1
VYECNIRNLLQYTICDMILLFQIYFYRWTMKVRLPIATDTTPNPIGEESPLLQESIREHGDKRHVSAKKLFIRYTAAVCFVVGTGVVAWWMSNGGEELDVSKPQEWRVQLMGWTSAILYRQFVFPHSPIWRCTC